MKHLKVLFVFLFVAMASLPTRALMVKISEEEIAKRSDVVVVVRVDKKSVTTKVRINSIEDLSPIRRLDGGFSAAIETEYSLQVLEVLKGGSLPEFLNVTSAGGRDEGSGIELRIEHSPHFEVGDYSVACLNRGEENTYQWCLLELGVIPLLKGKDVEDTKTLNRSKIDRARDLIAGRNPAPKITLFSAPTPAEPDSVNYEVGSGVGANTGEVFWIVGSNFRHEGSYADSLRLLSPGTDILWDGSPQNGLYIYWDVGILMELLGETVGSQPLVIWKAAEGQSVYNNWQTAPPLYVDFNYSGYSISSSSMAYEYDFTNLELPQGETQQDVQDALDAAMSSWNNASGITFSNASSSNKIKWSTGSYEGALAANWLSLSPGEVLSSIIVFYEGDYNFSTVPESGHFDIESIALHELGHSLYLDHVHGTYDEVGKVMFRSIGSGIKRRSLHSGEARGASWIYGP